MWIQAISIKACNVKMWSEQEYPFRKPAWFSSRILFSSRKAVNLLFRTEVKSLPRQLNMGEYGLLRPGKYLTIDL